FVRQQAADARRRREPLTCLVVSVGSDELVEAFRAGEELTRSLGTVMRRVLRGSDLIARVGQLEFAVVAPTVDRDRALQLVRRLEEGLAQVRPPGAPYLPLRAGIASAEDADRLDPEDLLGRALAAVGWFEPRLENRAVDLSR
ncbi:MAG: diguanylate cyclase, partial [Chloroflexi bacterium]|nr:diguanylate cyclase [Chloroflexota bacterium]